ncbi:hypothetical protein BU23DRAFT_536607, partial [Bimuria novae-zelandiae CBS 107.79]
MSPTAIPLTNSLANTCARPTSHRRHGGLRQGSRPLQRRTAKPPPLGPVQEGHPLELELHRLHRLHQDLRQRRAVLQPVQGRAPRVPRLHEHPGHEHRHQDLGHLPRRGAALGNPLDSWRRALYQRKGQVGRGQGRQRRQGEDLGHDGERPAHRRYPGAVSFSTASRQSLSGTATGRAEVGEGFRVPGHPGKQSYGKSCILCVSFGVLSRDGRESPAVSLAYKETMVVST